MASELYTRTNQKLYFAGLALEGWRRAEQTQVLGSQALVQAEREAAMFHLYGAALSLCHEVAGYYRLPTMGADRVETVLTREAIEASPTPELYELHELATQPSTWLGQLLQAYGRLFMPPVAPRKTRQDATLPLIEAVSVDEEGASPLVDDLEEWRHNLKCLALRFRESLTEC